MKADSLKNPFHLAFAFLLIFAIARLWIAPLKTSFWVDEMVTVFVVHHGPADPSLTVAPQVPKSIYYNVARAADAITGVSEDGYRIPSLLFAALALLFIARLAARLIHPDAAWFAAFACLGLRGFNQESWDARPYAMGLCVVAAAFYFLVRWLDTGKWLDAAAFVIAAALVLRVHLLFWPIYIVFAIYAARRVVCYESKVKRIPALLVFAIVGAALLPVFAEMLPLYRDAGRHVIVAAPKLHQLADALKWKLILECTAGAAALAMVLRSKPSAPWYVAPAIFIAGWWLIHPVALFAFSWITGNSVFVARYLSPALPGAALAATYAASRWIPANQWKRATLIFAAAVCLVMIPWTRKPQGNSDWRDAAIAVNKLAAQKLGTNMPVICPSPFVEAQSPAWQPDYSLPGFLYAHLPVYPLIGKEYLFPFKASPEAEQYAASLSRDVFASTGEFAIYGGRGNVRFWREWFDQQPELAGWSNRRLGSFGDVEVVVFERAH